MKKICVIALGGTIGSVRNGSIGLDDNNLKIFDYCSCEEAELVGCSPFSVLSENMSTALWQELIDYIDSIDKSEYCGFIVLHGSDTLTYTGALLGNVFPDESIVLVAADKPLEDKESNGVENFNRALSHLLEGKRGVYISYDGITSALCTTNTGAQDKLSTINAQSTPVRSKKIQDKNVLIVNSYVGMNMDNYNLDGVDAVLIGMYHSATVPDNVAKFAAEASVPVFFATHKSSADYKTAEGLKNIVFSTTLENAYIKILTNHNSDILTT